MKGMMVVGEKEVRDNGGRRRANALGQLVHAGSTGACRSTHNLGSVAIAPAIPSRVTLSPNFNPQLLHAATISHRVSEVGVRR